MAEEPLIAAVGLGKVFKTWKRKPGRLGVAGSFFRREASEVVALRAVDLVVGRGELVGLIGANGAGKTTLVKCLTGIVPVSSGSARLFGASSFHLRDEHKKRLSLVAVAERQ